MSYKHFSIEERNCIAYGIKNNKRHRNIAQVLGRSHSSVFKRDKKKYN